MNSLDKHYQTLLEEILEYGTKKQTRNGEVISVFGRQIRHRMREGFPLLTTKKLHWNSIVTELVWFLQGRTDLRWLLEQGNTIWVGDSYANYIKKPKELSDVVSDPDKFNGRNLSKEEFIERIKTDDEFAKQWGNLGPIYGKQWRKWEGRIQIEPCKLGSKWEYLRGDSYVDNQTSIRQEPIDQIQNLISELKTNPDSRRLMVNAWNVGELDQCVLPPCHYGFQVYTRELSLEERCDEYIKRHPKETNDGVLNYKWIGDNLCTHEDYDKWNIPTRAISLMWNQRSVDTPLGLPFNIASYALLLEIIAKMVNMVPDELIGNLGDCHIYSNQIDGVKEQLTREPYELPKLNINTEWWPTEGGECGVGPIDAQAVLNGFSKDTFCKCLIEDDIQLYDYKFHPPIKMPLSN
jgi:thymidylate synthase